MIKLEHLRKEYKDVTPIQDICATVNEGDVISIIGPSGTGKSTLIRCINLLETPTSGRILFHGEDITAKGADVSKVRQSIGMVFQSFNLFGHLTVIENLMIAPMDLQHKTKQEAYDNGMKLLERVGLKEKALNYPDELSGGQKQRVAIARTLATDPEVILLDEPTSALDPTMVHEVQSVIRELAKSGKTMLIVTHEMNFARSISNRVWYLDEGGIYEDGTPEEIFEHPSKMKTKEFVHRLRIHEAYVEGKDFDYIGFDAGLDRYMNENEIPAGLKYRIRLALEEVIRQILLPKFEQPHIRIAVEYSIAEQNCSITLDYAGEPFDINDTENELSLTLLKSITKKIEWSYAEGTPEPNKVKLLLE